MQVTVRRRSRNDRCLADPRYRAKAFRPATYASNFYYPYGRRRMAMYGSEFRGIDYSHTIKDAYDGPRTSRAKHAINRLLRHWQRADNKRLIATCEADTVPGHPLSLLGPYDYSWHRPRYDDENTYCDLDKELPEWIHETIDEQGRTCYLLDG